MASDCGFEPIGASIRAPILDPGGESVGACGRWVTIDGVHWSESNYTFDPDRPALEPFGEADAADDLVSPLAAPTIYSIAGVDPAEAVVMEAADGTFLVFTRDGSGGFPAELCPMLAPTGNPSTGSCD